MSRIYQVVCRTENVEDTVVATFTSRREAEEMFMELEYENEDPYTIYQVVVMDE